MRTNESIEHAAQQLGLTYKAHHSSAFGEVDGWLTQLTHAPPGTTDNEGVMVVMKWGDPASDDAVKRALAAAPNLQELGIRAKRVEIAAGTLAFKHQKSFLVGGPTPSQLVNDVHAFSAILQSGAKIACQTCTICGSTEGTATMLDGHATYVCEACVDELAKESNNARATYEQMPTNYALATVAAVVLCAVGSISWATLTILTETMFWMAGIGIGALLAWGTLKGAGKGGIGVQLIGGAFTILSVLLGQLMIIAWYTMQDMAPGQELDWIAFLLMSPQILLETSSDTLFALGGGLFGAWTAARSLGKSDAGIAIER